MKLQKTEYGWKSKEGHKIWRKRTRERYQTEISKRIGAAYLGQGRWRNEYTTYVKTVTRKITQYWVSGPGIETTWFYRLKDAREYLEP